MRRTRFPNTGLLAALSFAILHIGACGNEDVLLGPEHDTVVVQLQGTVSEVRGEGVCPPDIAIGEAVEVSLSFVPAHGLQSGHNVTFADSHRNFVAVAIGESTWTQRLHQFGIQNDEESFDSFSAQASSRSEDAPSIFSLQIFDRTEPFTLLDSDELPIGGPDVASIDQGLGLLWIEDCTDRSTVTYLVQFVIEASGERSVPSYVTWVDGLVGQSR